MSDDLFENLVFLRNNMSLLPKNIANESPSIVIG